MESAIARAYVQIVPTADGIKGKLGETLGPETESAGKEAGTSLGATIGKFVKYAIIAAGIGDVIRQAISEGADLEQSLGGIETLFKDNADMVKQYAQEAYRTAGLSANEYMESVTGFSASLLQGLSGDTAKAAEIANMAMIDMSDNANKMGTDMESIQYAYQGFAKQNYTMLDNLKLGYGGTKEEMARLLEDAQKISGVEYDMSNLSDVYEAIHVIQENLGITGTTAEEASETISGSLASVKAAWSNLLADMTLGNDVSGDIEALSETVMAAAKNILPAIANIIGSAPAIIIEVLKTLGPPLIDAGMEMVSNLASGLGESMPTLVDNALAVVLTIVNAILDNIDVLIESGLTLVIGLVTGILNSLPKLIEAVPVIVSTILTTLLSLIPEVIAAGLNLFTSLVSDLPTIISNIVNIIPVLIDAIIGAVCELIPMIINTGVELLTSLVTNVPDIITAILEVVPVIIVSLLEAITELAPMLVSAGFDLLTGLVKLLPEIIVAIVKAVVAIIDAIINTVVTIGKEFPQIGKNLIDGLWNGIKNGWSSLSTNVKNMANSLIKDIKDTFGIHSPSVVFKDEVGKMLDYGLADGIKENADVVSNAMNDISDLATDSMETDVVMNAVAGKQIATFNQSDAKLSKNDAYAIFRSNEEKMNRIILLLEQCLQQRSNVYLDKDVIVGQLAPDIDRELGSLSNKYQRGVLMA